MKLVPCSADLPLGQLRLRGWQAPLATMQPWTSYADERRYWSGGHRTIHPGSDRCHSTGLRNNSWRCTDRRSPPRKCKGSRQIALHHRARRALMSDATACCSSACRTPDKAGRAMMTCVHTVACDEARCQRHKGPDYALHGRPSVDVVARRAALPPSVPPSRPPCLSVSRLPPCLSRLSLASSTDSRVYGTKCPTAIMGISMVTASSHYGCEFR